MIPVDTIFISIRFTVPLAFGFKVLLLTANTTKCRDRFARLDPAAKEKLAMKLVEAGGSNW